jgi:uncharacterized membrane protein YfcA
VTAPEVALLIASGLAAGLVNTLAGAGSLLTVPLLVLLGLPGTLANGTNRVGILLHNTVAAARFRLEGVSGFEAAIPLLVPVILGSMVGALSITRVSDGTFERLFGLIMVALLIPILRRPPAVTPSAPRPQRLRPASFAVFFGIGLYGGAFQAGVGIFLLLALSYSGYDLVNANSIKVVINAVLVATALPVFVWHGQVSWVPALLLASGFALGGEIGARVAVRGGERIIRPVLVLSVVALAGKMIGLY